MKAHQLARSLPLALALILASACGKKNNNSPVTTVATPSSVFQPVVAAPVSYNPVSAMETDANGFCLQTFANDYNNVVNEYLMLTTSAILPNPGQSYSDLTTACQQFETHNRSTTCYMRIVTNENIIASVNALDLIPTCQSLLPGPQNPQYGVVVPITPLPNSVLYPEQSGTPILLNSTPITPFYNDNFNSHHHHHDGPWSDPGRHY